MNRQETIESLLNSVDAAKRSMHERMQLAVRGSSLSQTQFGLLVSIKYAEPVSAKELAQTARLTPGAISQLIDGLDEGGFIERTVDPQDRRRQLISISKKGHQRLAAVEERRRMVMKNVLQGLTDHELSLWLRIQQRIIDEFQHLEESENKRKQA